MLRDETLIKLKDAFDKVKSHDILRNEALAYISTKFGLEGLFLSSNTKKEKVK